MKYNKAKLGKKCLIIVLIISYYHVTLAEYKLIDQKIKLKSQNLNILGQYRKEYLDIRSKMNELDSLLTYNLVLRTGLTIFSVMLNIYVLAIIKSIPQLGIFMRTLGICTEISIAEILLSAFFCGLVHEKSDQIYSVLDDLTANDLSDYEYNEWLMFKNICRKTRFGFTIGGFAPIRKTTLIPVFLNIIKF